MVQVNLEKTLIQNALSTDKQLSHYARETIIAICGKAAGLLGK